MTYKGESLTYLQPGWYCETGDDGILEADDNEVHDAALHEVMARAKQSPISPLYVRAAREAVGASQREAGRLFGGGETAFYKYETAKSVPSDGMANLLWLALGHPEIVRELSRNPSKFPSPHEAEIVRHATRSKELDTIMRRVYPQAADKSPAASASSLRRMLRDGKPVP